MLKTSAADGTNIVTLPLEGSVSADEDDAAQQTIAAVAAYYGKARMLLDYEGIDLSRSRAEGGVGRPQRSPLAC